MQIVSDEAVEVVRAFCRAMAEWERECAARHERLDEDDFEGWQRLVEERTRAKAEILRAYTTERAPAPGFSFGVPSDYEVEVEEVTLKRGKAVIRVRCPASSVYDFHVEQAASGWRVSKRVARFSFSRPMRVDF